MIELENIRYKIYDKIILDNINLTLEKKRIGIIGANGSGKSTLVRLIKGLIKSTSGIIKVDGLNITKNKNILTKVGIIFQNPDNQVIFPTVREDISFGLMNRGFSRMEVNEAINNIVKHYAIESLIDRQTHSLSGGEKRLISILGVFVMNPKYIIFDEPTIFLDLRNRNKVYKIIKDLTQSCIVVSHDLELFENFDTVIVMHEGKIIAEKQPDMAIELYKSMSKYTH